MLNRNVEARPSSKLLNGILSKILEKKLKFEKETIEELLKVDSNDGEDGAKPPLIIGKKYQYIKNLKSSRIMLVMDLETKKRFFSNIHFFIIKQLILKVYFLEKFWLTPT